MPWTPIVGRAMTLVQVQEFIDGMTFDRWRPTGIVVHNTGVPSLKQWHQVSGEARMRNLEHYFRNQRGWSSAPHAFVADDFIWPFTPFNAKGTHSPSWNGTKLGIEMVADFAIEDPYSGPGFGVYRNTVALFGMLHQKLGLNPDSINLHKEDPRTTHDCPGRRFDKRRFINEIKDWMNHGGDDAHYPDEPAAKPKVFKITNTPGDTLNLREGASVGDRILAELPHGTIVEVFSSEMNRTTKWLRVEAAGITGWISAHFTKEAKL